MKKILFVFTILFLLACESFANEEILAQQNTIQSRINNIGTKILNSNKIEKKVIFTYDEAGKTNLIKGDKTLTKRQVVVYGELYKHIETDDELAGYIAREIVAAVRSYDGLGNGVLSSIKIKAAPKKYELIFDSLAIDYMVKAGYNPLGLITFINKTCPQARQDKISGKNLTSKRLAYIYEKIYMTYPSFLSKNEYLENEYYQNFLLTSQNNRKIFAEKIKSGDIKKKTKYE